MEKPFRISFDFSLAHSAYILPLSASATLHHSDPYYVVEDFRVAGDQPNTDTTSILPPQEIKELTRGNHIHWVHKDSERETELSIAIGRAIEKIRLKRTA
ncbi:MAG: hypothetical protein ABIR30_05400 [Chitinophagaceae bacterium]